MTKRDSQPENAGAFGALSFNATPQQFGKDGAPETVVPKITQEMLAEMVGTTRARVSFFMNRFRKMGFIHYNGGLQVHSSLLNIVLHD
jgi:CRP/FNR family transcriptional regulator, cyclic AMP receptor protein